MRVEFDPAKRAWTLRNRGLDLADAGEIFEGFTLTFEDDREEYEEDRFVTFGIMKGKLVACVWTFRGDNRRIISLRKAEKDEREIYNLWRP
ncbi:MAG TPA: BrnT family toxin [Allosphingosinicella sp.]|nr:BrnT family toxin [Allosphingosinicella sp.]